METHDKKDFFNKKKSPKAPFDSFLFVFLSLALILLTFFIYLVHNSNFEKIKLDALTTSLRSSFSTFTNISTPQASLIDNKMDVYYQDLISNFFFDDIDQNVSNKGISVYFNTSSIFQKDSEELNRQSILFIKKLSDLITNHHLYKRFNVQILLFENLAASEDYPIFNNLTFRRVQSLWNELMQKNINVQQIQIGIQKGDPNKILVFFRKKDSL